MRVNLYTGLSIPKNLTMLCDKLCPKDQLFKTNTLLETNTHPSKENTYNNNRLRRNFTLGSCIVVRYYLRMKLFLNSLENMWIEFIIMILEILKILLLVSILNNKNNSFYNNKNKSNKYPNNNNNNKNTLWPLSNMESLKKSNYNKKN